MKLIKITFLITFSIIALNSYSQENKNSKEMKVTNIQDVSIKETPHKNS